MGTKDRENYYESGTDFTPLSPADRRAEIKQALAINRDARQEQTDSLINSWAERLRHEDPAMYLEFQIHFAQLVSRPAYRQKMRLPEYPPKCRISY